MTLSVVIDAVNTSTYFDETVASVFAQRMNFDFEVLVFIKSNDISLHKITLRNEQIYFNRIKVFHVPDDSEKSFVFGNVFGYTQGKYVAFLTVGDSWIDKFKLQRQIDFLQQHSDYSFSCHRIRESFLESDLERNIPYSFLFDKNQEGIELNFESSYLFKSIHFSSIVLRKEVLDSTNEKMEKLGNMWFWVYELLNSGKGFLHSFIGGKSYKSQLDLRQSHNHFQYFHDAFNQFLLLVKIYPEDLRLYKQLEQNLHGMSLRNRNASFPGQEWIIIKSVILYYRLKLRVKYKL